jgi:hypothetical protein
MQPAYRFSSALALRPGLSLASAMRYGRFKGPASGQIQAPQTTPATAEGIQQLAQKQGAQQNEAQLSWLDCALAQALTFGKCAEALGGSSGSTGSGSSSSGSKSKSPLSGQGVMSGMSPAREQMPNQPMPNAAMPGQAGNMMNAPGMQGMAGVPGMMSPMATPKAQEVGAFGVVRPGWSTLKPGPVGPGPKSAAMVPMGYPALLSPVLGRLINHRPNARRRRHRDGLTFSAARRAVRSPAARRALPLFAAIRDRACQIVAYHGANGFSPFYADRKNPEAAALRGPAI